MLASGQRSTDPIGAGGSRPPGFTCPHRPGGRRHHYRRRRAPNFRGAEPTINPRSAVTGGRYGGRAIMEKRLREESCQTRAPVDFPLPTHTHRTCSGCKSAVCRWRAVFHFWGAFFVWGMFKWASFPAKKYPRFRRRSGHFEDLVVFSSTWDLVVFNHSSQKSCSRSCPWVG